MQEQTGCDGFMIARGAQGQIRGFSHRYCITLRPASIRKSHPLRNGASTPDDTAPCTHDDRVQGRVHGDTRDEKAHSVVYGRISILSRLKSAAVNTVESLEQLEELLYKEKLQN